MPMGLAYLDTSLVIPYHHTLGCESLLHVSGGSPDAGNMGDTEVVC
jgi:hypothetical protein